LQRFAALISGLVSGLALAVRPAGSAEAPRARVGPEDAFCGAVRKDLRVPLRVEGPGRTMRGVPARVPVTFARRPVHLARDDRPGHLAERMTHGALRRVSAVAGCGASARRAAARDGALSRKRKRARLPRHLRRESLTSLAAMARHCPARSRSPCTSRASFARSARAGRPGAPKVRP